VAQAIHAAGESCGGQVPPGTFAIALASSGEIHLRQLADSLSAAGVDFRLIVEPDWPYCGQAMAIGIVPTKDRDRIRTVTSSLPLTR
jgi:hypothetical protein